MLKNIANYSFNLSIEKSILDDILYRVRRSRIVNDFGNKEWKYGTEETYLKDLIETKNRTLMLLLQHRPLGYLNLNIQYQIA